MFGFNHLQLKFRSLCALQAFVVFPITGCLAFSLTKWLMQTDDFIIPALVSIGLITFLAFYIWHVAQKVMMFGAIGFKVLGNEIRGSGCKKPEHKLNKIEGYTYDEKNGYYYKIKDPFLPTVVFLHGNIQPACCFIGFLEGFGLHQTHNLIIFEYRGYGRRYPETTCSCSELDIARDDIAKQWAHIATNRVKGPMIIVGLSLGGGYAWSALHKLSPAPEQLVLLNTFADLKIFIKHMVGWYFYPFAFCFMSKDLLSYDLDMLKNKDWKGSVLCVYTMNDDLFHDGLHHALFKKYFSEQLGCAWEEVRREVGGHSVLPDALPSWKEKVLYSSEHSTGLGNAAVAAPRTTDI